MKLRSGKKLTPGDIYVFTIDTSNILHVVLSTANVTAGIEDVVSVATNHNGVCYDITGKKLGHMTPENRNYQNQRQIILVDGKKIAR